VFNRAFNLNTKDTKMGLFDSIIELGGDIIKTPVSILEDISEGDITLSNTRENVKDIVDDTANAVKSTIDLDL
jgi:hypothetical protein